MEGFLKFIMILILVWLGITLFIRYLFPRLLLYYVKRKQKKMMEQMGIDPEMMQQDKGKKKKSKKNKEGEVSIDKVPDKKRKGSSENMGEYVDFEEIDD